MSRKQLRRHVEQDGLIDLGLCPNGCGPMTRPNDYDDDCPVCGFHYSRNVPRELS